MHATRAHPLLFPEQDGTEPSFGCFESNHIKEIEMSDTSTQTFTASFKTREAADLAVEHLVQKLEIERTDVFVRSVGSANASGVKPSGGDAPTATEEGRTDAQLLSEIEVSVDIDLDSAARVDAELKSLGASDVIRS
jgi:hypothetical protein